MWFKRAQPRRSFPVGEYSLGMQIAGGPPLREFSADEYEAIGRQFEGEKNFHAPPADFLGRQWNLMLGTVDGYLYKLAPYLEFPSRVDANETAFPVLTFCNQQLGKPAQQKTGLFMWDTSDGNVVFQTAEAADGFAVNLFLTSARVREFRRLR